jgi:hypothetical protein
LDDVDEFSCADSDARAGAELASQTRFRCIPGSSGSYGRNSDGGVFANSKLGKYLETHQGIPEDEQLPGTLCLAHHVIMGDEVFPLNTYLLQLYPGSQSKGNNEKSIFNYMLSRCRSVAENAFGILSQKFQIYQDDRTIFVGEWGHHYFCDLYFAELSARSRCRPKPGRSRQDFSGRQKSSARLPSEGK